ncbi:hypothetical protein HQ576_18865 [bacterium]|nr:hypothetical protein [bacterium]
MSVRILAVGVDARHEAIEQATIDSDVSFADYDVVLVDPAVVTALWAGVGGAGRSGDSQVGRNLLHVIQRRRREVAALLATGGKLLCMLRPVGAPLRVRQRRSDGAATTSMLHAYSWLPPEAGVAQLVIAEGPGTKVVAADERHLAWRLMQALAGGSPAGGVYGDALAYEAYVANDQLAAEWHVVATTALGHPVAFELRVGKGQVIFIPPMSGQAPDERGRALVGVLAPTHDVPKTAPPPWLTHCLLPGQADVAERIPVVAEQVQRRQAELDDLNARHEALSRLNLLLYASSPAELAIGVAAAFELLGFTVSPIPGEADCLDVACGDAAARVVLATVDGTVDSDPYWRATQLLEEDGAPPKGVIVANAHRTKHPRERGLPFSDLLRRGAHHKSLALVDTVALTLAVARLVERPDDDLRAQVRAAILDAEGPCQLHTLLARDAAAES